MSCDLPFLERERYSGKNHPGWEEVFQAVGHIVLILDAHHRVMAANSAALKALGCGEEDLLGRHCYEIFHAGERPPEGCPLRKMLESGRLETFEMELEVLDRSFLVSCTPVFKNGELDAVIHVATDISGRKSAEEQSLHLNRKLRAISACNQAMVRSVDEQTLLDDVCRIICDVGGYRMAWVGVAEQDEDKSVRPVASAGFDDGYLAGARISWADTERGRGPTGTAVRTGKTSYFHDLIDDPKAVLWRERALKRDYRCSIALPLPDANGSVLGALTIYSSMIGAFTPDEAVLLEELAGNLAYGIVALRTREERRRADEARSLLVSLIESTNDAVLAMDLDGTIISWNNGAERIYGYSSAEIIGKTVDSLVPESRHDEIRAILESIKGGRSISHFESERTSKSGTVFPVSMTVSPILDPNGKIICASVIARDISELKKAEEERKNLEQYLIQAQKLEAIGALAGGIAHDFNNVLSPIIGFAEIALMKISPDNPFLDDFQCIRDAGLRAKALVSQILAFARKTENQKTPVPVGSIIKEVLKFIRASVPATIDIRSNISSEAAHGMVLGDPTQIHQIIMNLCTNAAHSMLESGGVLTVSLGCSEIGPAPALQNDAVVGPGLRLSVSDTGRGMTEEVIARMFEPFFTTKIQGEGTGLGLSVVYGIVRSLGGTISVESRPGEGTAFHIDLPMMDNPENMEAITPTVVPARGRGEALLVDDEAMLTRVGKEMLECLGFEVLAMNRSPEALRIFRENPDRFSLVVTDQTMPHMTGIELTRAMLSLRPALPVVLCTGFSETVSEEVAKKAGVRELLQKPLGIQALSDAIWRIQGNT